MWLEDKINPPITSPLAGHDTSDDDLLLWHDGPLAFFTTGSGSRWLWVFCDEEEEWTWCAFRLAPEHDGVTGDDHPPFVVMERASVERYLLGMRRGENGWGVAYQRPATLDELVALNFLATDDKQPCEANP